MLVSVPETCGLSDKISEIIAPLFCIKDFCLALFVVPGRAVNVLDNSRILAKVSTIALVV
jgi:hypothetical protein